MAEYYNKDTKIITVPNVDTPIHEDGLGCSLYEKMKTYSDRVCQIDAVTGEEDTFASFLDRCIRTAQKMREMGLKPGDIISICSHNHLDNSVPLIAALFNGIVVASLDPTISQEDTNYLMGIVGPKVVFVSEGSEKLMQNAAIHLGIKSEIVVFGDSDEFMEFREFSKFECNVDEFKPRVTPSVEDVAVIMFSSGTTGLPKGICISHKVFLHACRDNATGIFFGYASLYWLSAHLITYFVLLFGNTKIVNFQFDIDNAWQNLHKYKVNNLFLAPSDAIQLSHRLPDYELTHVKLVIIGGGGIPWEFVVKLRTHLKDAIVGLAYGQTELMNVFSFVDPIAYDKPSCVGLPTASRAYKIVDPETEEILGPNQEGEIRIKSDYCMNGYYNVDSSSAWDSDGFIKTGDIAYFDDDFCFFIVDRIKEMFKYKGWHIVPAQLEAIILNHPAVELAVVVGIPHTEDGYHPTAVVIPRKGVEANAEEIGKFVDDQVDDRHKLRGGVRFVDEFPLTPSGKIRRRELVKMVVKGDI